MEDKLKLSALDADDLGVISAAVQDSLVAVRDCAYFADEKRFVLLLNRFRWEADATVETAYWRTHSALGFQRGDGRSTITRSRSQEPDRVLELLAVGPGKRPVRSSCASPPAAPYGWKSTGSRAIWGMSGSLGPPRGSPPIRPNSPSGTRGAGIRVLELLSCRAKPTRS